MTHFEQIIHEFLRNPKQELTGLNGERIQNNKVYLNKTCLGAFLSGVLCVSGSSITPKCSQFSKELIATAKGLNLTVLEIPQYYSSDKRHHEFEPENIERAFTEEVSLLVDNRDVYTRATLEKYRETIEKLPFTVNEKLLKKISSTITKINKALAKEEKELKALIKQHSYYDLAQIAFFSYGNYSSVMRGKLRQYLNPTGEYAFLKADFKDGYVYSSECKCGLPKRVMTIDEALAITTAWMNGTARHGQRYGKYTVMAVMTGYIHVSCNKYCKDMFDALYYELQKC